VFILAPLDPGVREIVTAGGDELSRPEGPSIEARRAEGGGMVLGSAGLSHYAAYAAA